MLVQTIGTMMLCLLLKAGRDTGFGDLGEAAIDVLMVASQFIFVVVLMVKGAEVSASVRHLAEIAPELKYAKEEMSKQLESGREEVEKEREELMRVMEQLAKERLGREEEKRGREEAERGREVAERGREDAARGRKEAEGELEALKKIV